MAEPKPLLDKFGIHLRLQGCVMSTLEYNLNMGPDNFKNLKKIGAQIIFEAVFRYGEEFFWKSEFLIVTCHLYIVFLCMEHYYLSWLRHEPPRQEMKSK